MTAHAATDARVVSLPSSFGGKRLVGYGDCVILRKLFPDKSVLKCFALRKSLRFIAEIFVLGSL